VGRQSIALLAGVLVVGIVVAGCGGGDSSAASITKAEFIKKADAACEKGEKEIEKDFAAYSKSHENLKEPTKDDYSELVDAVFVPNAEQELDEIQALGAPTGDEEQIDTMLEARKESIAAAENEPEQAVTNSSSLFGESSQLAKAYGLKVCGRR
jgi:hypothetical protein